ncbi:MAG: CDP-alcohol phosphatidyltransferase family protein [Candidatus Lloydbacteria bacterium]|nr:CDP-alcohol phosphatidyltransferase family protein [Candidatus Lloydbacteria bacterium]
MNGSSFCRLTKAIARFFARYTTANIITAGRCLVALLMIPVWILGGLNGQIFALVLWAGCWYLDAVDGVMAREEGQASEVGKWLDPLADKIQFYSTMSLFLNYCDLFVLGGLFFADGYSTIKRGFGKQTAVVGANGFGKGKTVLQIIAFFSFSLAELSVFPIFVASGNILLYGACGCAIVSIIKRTGKHKSP